MPDTPPEVQDAVSREGESVLVEVEEQVVAVTFEEAIKLGYNIIRLAVNSQMSPTPSHEPSPG
jgi:hypothetical protein